MWYNALTSSLFIEDKENFLREKKYLKAVQLAFGNIKEPVTFHESRRVSMDLILPAFFLCGIVMAIGVIGFMVENWMTEKLWKLGTARIWESGTKNMEFLAITKQANCEF